MRCRALCPPSLLICALGLLACDGQLAGGSDAGQGDAGGQDLFRADQSPGINDGGITADGLAADAAPPAGDATPGADTIPPTPDAKPPTPDAKPPTPDAKPPTPVDGVCGPADGVPSTVKPTSGLCSAGVPSTVSGSGPWTWSCAGTNGGATASCSAPKSTPPTGVELPGPSAALHSSHPYYTCVTNRYVATAANGGSDSNDGQAPTVGGGHGPWLTLQHAASAIPSSAPGWCVNIGDGTYSISSTVNMNHGGNQASMTGFTVWRATNLLGAKLVATSSPYNVVHAGASYLIIDGLEIVGAKKGSGITSCFNCCGYNGLHHIIIMNSYIHNNGEGGIGHCWADYFWVLHNRLDENAYNSWYSGVSIYEPAEIPGYTPTSYDKQWTPYHIVIAYNRCYGNFTSPAGSPHTDGNGIIYDDTLHEQNSPNTPYVPRALIMGNVAWGNGGFGIQVGPTSANADVFNNTCYDNGLDTYNTGTWRGELSSAISKGNVFKNNIGFAVKGSGILANNTPFLGGNPVAATNSWSNNIAFGNAPNMTSPDAFPTPANKVNTDPQLVSVQGANFALKSGSPAIGFGAVVPYWQQQTAGAIDVGACPSGVTTCP
jgi:hypothetical protein